MTDSRDIIVSVNVVREPRGTVVQTQLIKNEPPFVKTGIVTTVLGKDGSMIYVGTGAPLNTLGVYRDLYIDNASPKNFYQKNIANEWVLQGFIQGEKGADGRGIVSFDLFEVQEKTKIYRLLYTDATYVDIPIIDGNDGVDGATPYIGQNGNWWIRDVDQNIKAAGTDGVSPTIGQNGNWYLGATDTGVKAQGKDGYTPIKGVDYFDGYTPIKNIDYFDGYTPIKGVDYFDGKPVEMQASTTHIQYKLVGDLNWINIVALADLKGADGKNIELGASETHLQWRVVGDTTWINLIAIADLKGAKGDAGVGIPTGGTTGQKLVKKSNADYDTEFVDDTGQANVIEVVQVNTVPLTVTNKTVNIPVPTEPGDIGAEPAKGTDDNYVTDAEKTVLANTSGTNTGDQNLSGLVKTDQSTPQTIVGRQRQQDGLQLGLTPTIGTHEIGKVFWDADWKTPACELEDDVTLQIGQETLVYVYNNTGSTINQGDVVYSSTTFNGVPSVALARGDMDVTSQVLGVITTTSILTGAYGYATIRGHVNNIDTSLFSINDNLYLSADVAGKLTNVKPNTGDYDTRVGRVMIQNATTGRVYVNIIREYKVGTVSAGNGVDLFLDDTTITASGTQSTYPIKTLSKTPIASAEDVDSIVMNNNSVMYGVYLNTAPIGKTSIAGGAWTFEIWAGVSSATNVTSLSQLVQRVRPEAGTVTITNLTATSKTVTASEGTPFATTKIDVGGTLLTDSFLQTPKGLYRILTRVSDLVCTIEVPSTYTNETTVAYSVYKTLFSVNTGEINNVTAPTAFAGLQVFNLTTVQAAFTVLATDTLATAMVGTSTGSRTVYFSHNGTNRYTHFHTPLVTSHNDLSGLNDGDFKHLTATQLSDLTSAGSTFLKLDQTTPQTLTQSPKITSLTEGQMCYVDANKQLKPIDAFWDNTLKTLGISMSSPTAKIEVSGDSLIPSAYSGILRFRTNSTSNNSALKMGAISGVGAAGYSWIQGSHVAVDNAGDIAINQIGGSVVIGGITPKSKLDVRGGIQCGDDTAAASIDKKGTRRYREWEEGGFGYSAEEECMKTGINQYTWIAIVTNSWTL